MSNIPIVLAILALATVSSASLAIDKQGKRDLETPTSRAKENAPTKFGSQRVQDQTKSRTDAALGKSRSSRQQEKTRGEAKNALKP